MFRQPDRTHQGGSILHADPQPIRATRELATI